MRLCGSTPSELEPLDAAEQQHARERLQPHVSRARQDEGRLEDEQRVHRPEPRVRAAAEVDEHGHDERVEAQLQVVPDGDVAETPVVQRVEGVVEHDEAQRERRDPHEARELRAPDPRRVQRPPRIEYSTSTTMSTQRTRMTRPTRRMLACSASMS